jgi:hypothetical protein
LLTITEHAERDRHGRRWIAGLTADGRQLTDPAP